MHGVYALYCLIDYLRAFNGLFSGIVGNVRSLLRVSGNFQHGSIHFFHGGCGFAHTRRLFIRATARLLNLGGEFLGSGGYDFYHAFKLVGSLKHALGLGALGLTAGFFRIGSGLLGALGFFFGLLALLISLRNFALQGSHHLLHRAKNADLRPCRIKLCLQIPARNLQGKF